VSSPKPSVEELLLTIKELRRENKELSTLLTDKINFPAKAPFPLLVINLLNRYLPERFGWVTNLYIHYISLLNYAFVGFVGYLINTSILYVVVSLFPLWLANAIAVCVAFLSNWTFSVGPLGHLMGLRPKSQAVKK